jgi:Spy/CpxP family protein refolding chaperone
MTTRLLKYLLPCLILAVPAGLFAQGGAQGSRGGFFPWWESPMVNGLDLTDTQRTQIRSVVQEYRGRMLEVRSAVQKAEGDLDAVFNEDTVDQRRGAEAIDRLTKARADMTKSVSEMSLRMRALLTTQQWQELQRRQSARIENAGAGSKRGGGRGRRLAKNGSKDGSKDGSKAPAIRAETQTPPPALSQQ